MRPRSVSRRCRSAKMRLRFSFNFAKARPARIVAAGTSVGARRLSCQTDIVFAVTGVKIFADSQFEIWNDKHHPLGSVQSATATRTRRTLVESSILNGGVTDGCTISNSLTTRRECWNNESTLNHPQTIAVISIPNLVPQERPQVRSPLHSKKIRCQHVHRSRPPS